MGTSKCNRAPKWRFFLFHFFLCVCVYLECRGSKTLNITDPGSTWQRLANIGEYNIMIHCLFSYFEDPGVPPIAHHFGKTHHWVTVEIPSSNPSGFSTWAPPPQNKLFHLSDLVVHQQAVHSLFICLLIRSLTNFTSFHSFIQLIESHLCKLPSESNKQQHQQCT